MSNCSLSFASCFSPVTVMRSVSAGLARVGTCLVRLGTVEMTLWSFGSDRLVLSFAASPSQPGLSGLSLDARSCDLRTRLAPVSLDELRFRSLVPAERPESNMPTPAGTRERGSEAESRLSPAPTSAAARPNPSLLLTAPERRPLLMFKFQSRKPGIVAKRPCQPEARHAC
ncbi:uncharacterized protein BKA78DRAFT_119457 [Phyllosticta capitalensis]|uniref:uncharacterized protein n=1 Tax=Phyllosticta capitalensis TaxID=121624 RepID=UPI00313042BF